MSVEPLIFIGRTKWRDMDRPFGLRPRDRQAHMYVIGKTGTGKSSLLEAMIRQDILSGNGVAVFDPHGDLAERLYAWMPESRKGDLIYYDERERHYLRSEGDEDMVFVEFFVPGKYKTVWVEGAPICTWSPTGRNIRGETPAREIKGHSSAVATPQDV